VVGVTVASGGPQPSELKWTAPTSKPSTIGMEFGGYEVDLSDLKADLDDGGFFWRLKKPCLFMLLVEEVRF
jgi:hypothetical protein